MARIVRDRAGPTPVPATSAMTGRRWKPLARGFTRATSTLPSEICPTTLSSGSGT